MEKGLSYKNCSYRRNNVTRKHILDHEGEGRKSSLLSLFPPPNFLPVTSFGQAQLKAKRQDDSGPKVSLWGRSAGQTREGSGWIWGGR